MPEFSNPAGSRFRTTSAAQDHFMASRQGRPRERKRDRDRTDRSELHDPTSQSFEKPMRVLQTLRGRAPCSVSVKYAPWQPTDF